MNSFYKKYYPYYYEDEYDNGDDGDDGDFATMKKKIFSLSENLCEFNIKYNGDLSFLNSYNARVRYFFKELIFANSKIDNPMSKDPSFFLSLLETKEDILSVYECLDKNNFLFLRNFNKDKVEITQKILLVNSNTNSFPVTLNFIFEDFTETRIINSIFLTGRYFRNSLEMQTEYSFNLEFEFNSSFCDDVFNYLLTGCINLTRKNIFHLQDFANMLSMFELEEKIRIYLEELEQEDLKGSFFSRKINFYSNFMHIEMYEHYFFFDINKKLVCSFYNTNEINDENIEKYSRHFTPATKLVQKVLDFMGIEKNF